MNDLKLNGPSFPPPITPRTRTGQTGPLPDLPAMPAVPSEPVAVDNLRVVPSGRSMQSLDWLDAQSLQAAPLATLDAHFRVQDIDGLDQRSRSDLRGQLDADIHLGRGLFDRSIDLANSQNPDFHFGISFENGQYRIPVQYKTRLGNIGLGSIYIKPEGGKLNVSIGGLAGGVASVANFISFGNVKPIVESLIHSLSADMGFKVSSASITDYTLEPDLQNSPLFREFPLAGGEKLKLESVQSGQGSLVNLRTDAGGNLQLSVKNLDVVASSGPGAAKAVPDAEGPDQLQVDAKGQLNRDFSSDVSTQLALSLDVRDTEKAGLQQRIKALTGQDLPVSGKVSIQDLKVQTHLEANGQIGKVTSQGGQVDAEKLDLQLGTTQASFEQISGGLNVARQGKVTRLEASGVTLQGQFASPQGQLQIQNLALSGVLQHDEARPQDLRFALAPDQTLQFSGQLKQGNQGIGIQNLSLRNAELQARLGDGQIQLLGANGKTPVASVQKLTLPGSDLRSIQLTGTLNASLNSGAIDLDAQSFSLGGKIGDIRLDRLSGSGRFHFDPASGVQLEGASFNAKGKAGDFGFSKLSGNGSLSVSPAGQVTLKEVTGLDLVSDMGLSLHGSFKGQLLGQQVDVETIGKNPARLDFKPKPDSPEAQFELRGLGLKGAHLQANLAGQLSLESRKGQVLSATAQSLKLPGVEIKGLTMKGGQLQADVNTGHVSLRSLPQQALEASADQLTLPGIEISHVKLKGGLEADSRTGQVDINASSFGLQAQIGDIGLNKLNGSGKAHISPNGDIHMEEVHNLDLELSMGLKLKGDFKGDLKGNHVVADTLSGKSARIDYRSPDGQLNLTGVEVQGHVDADFNQNLFHFESAADGSLKVAAAQFGDVQIEHVALNNGSLNYKPGELQLAPLPGTTLKASGQIESIHIQSLETSGPVTYDLNKQTVHWDQPTRVALPDHGVAELRTEGPVSLQALPSGEIVFSSHGGQINATIGQLRLENLKTEGQVIYNPANGQLRFSGFDGKPLAVDGTFNGHPLKLSSSGQIQIEDTGSAFKISGQQIKLSGLVDGFTLDSPAGAQGTVSVKHDFSGFELQDLNFGFTLDDVSVAKGGGGIRTTPEGLEISLKGALGADKGQLQALLSKLSSREDFGAHFQETMAQVNASLGKSIADFKNASLNFENLTIKINPDGTLRNFSVDNNTQLHNAQLEADLYGKKKVLPMGDVTWTAKVEGDASQLRIPSGHIAFALTEDLRKSLAEEIKNQLEDAGLKKVKLEIEPDGKVKILNATVDGKLIDLSARMELSTHIVNNQLEVSLDKMHLRNFLLDIIGQLANAPDKVADQVDSMLAQQHLKYQRRNAKGSPDPQSGRVFALDLQSLLAKIDPGITLKNASLDAQGRVQMDYSYARKMN